jgi:hypothetical protein
MFIILFPQHIIDEAGAAGKFLGVLCFIPRKKVAQNLEFGQSGHSMFDVCIGGNQFRPPVTPNLCIWIHHSEFDTSGSEAFYYGWGQMSNAQNL